MISKQIYSKLENIYKLKQDKAYAEQKARFNKACENEEFKKLYSQKRSLESEVAKCKALNLPLNANDIKLDAATKEYNEFIKENNIDLDVHFDCPICKDSGFVDNHRCACYQKELVNLLKDKCAISPMPNYTFEDNRMQKYNVPQKETMNALFTNMEKFCDNFDTSKLKTILISGSVGCGKTFLASCIANKLLDNAKQVIYLTAFDFSRIIQAKQFNSDNSLASLYPSLFECDLLILDDVGAEPMFKNFSREYFLSVIDHRTSHNQKTMICTNLKQMDFIERYGERAFSRLNEKPNGFSIIINGDDLRKIKEK